MWKVSIYICEHVRNKRNVLIVMVLEFVNLERNHTNTMCRTYGNRKLNGFCCHCFVNLFPDDPRALSVRKKSKELEVVSHIANKYDGFIHDKPFM
jgi:hypothetical protein